MQGKAGKADAKLREYTDITDRPVIHPNGTAELLPLHFLKDNDVKTAFYSLPQISFLEYEISQCQKIPEVKNLHYNMNQIHFINTRNRK